MQLGRLISIYISAVDKCGSAAASLRSIYNKLKRRPSSWLLFLQPDYINYAEDAENVRTGYTAITKEMMKM